LERIQVRTAAAKHGLMHQKGSNMR
jgi:hypothetical protein